MVPPPLFSTPFRSLTSLCLVKVLTLKTFNPPVSQSAKYPLEKIIYICIKEVLRELRSQRRQIILKSSGERCSRIQTVVDLRKIPYSRHTSYISAPLVTQMYFPKL